MEASFEEIARKYHSVKNGKTSVDLLSLKSETESYIRISRAQNEKMMT